MSRYILYTCAACLVLLTLARTGRGAETPQPPGFNGIGWGQPIASVRNLTIASSDGRTLFFTRMGERFTLGGADMEEVFYGFYDNKFYAAVMRFRGLVLFKRTLEALSVEYGPPDTSNNITRTYGWKWPEVHLRLNWEGSIGRGEVSFTFIPLALEREQDYLHGAGR